ncbi:hypothetical protein FGB62_35g010 [Gracilaria domingensis]|nr:hypothetical protein FGB62_35g010 [Gracilaria domingensis]
MILYRNKNMYTKKGVEKVPSPIRFLAVVRLLSGCLTFGVNIGGSSRTANGYRPKPEVLTYADEHQEEENGGTGAVPLESPTAARQKGTKRQKLEKTMERNISKVAGSVNELNETIKSSAASKKQAASIALQLKILHRMSLSTDVMNKHFENLMKQAAVLGGFSTNQSLPPVFGNNHSNADATDGPSPSQSFFIENASPYQQPQSSKAPIHGTFETESASAVVLSLVTRPLADEGDGARARAERAPR